MTVINSPNQPVSIPMLAMALCLFTTGCASRRPVPLPEAGSLITTTVDATALAAVQYAHPSVPPSPVDLTSPLSDIDAGRLALIGSPDLGAARAGVGVAGAQLFAAGLLPDPQLSLSLDRPAGISLVDALAAGIGLDLASLFVRADKVAAARHSANQTRLDVAWTEWLAFNHVRTLVRRIDYLNRQIALAKEAETIADGLYALTHEAMSRGDARLDDATIYQIGYLDARDRRLGLERQLETTWLDLDASIGLAPGVRLRLAPAPELRALAGLDQRIMARDAVTSRLDLHALREAYASMERNVAVATRTVLPLPQLGLNRARDTAGIWSKGASIGFALPLWNRNSGEIAIATATRTQLAMEYTARVHQANGDIAATLADLRNLERERLALAQQLPTLEASAEVIAAATREGSLPLTTYETIRASLLGKRLTLLALEQAQSEGEVALEAALGGLLKETAP